MGSLRFSTLFMALIFIGSCSDLYVFAARERIPKATIVVRKHAVGADMVEITLQNPLYDRIALKSFSERIGHYLGFPSRGVRVGSQKIDGVTGDLNFLKATFATNGICDDKEGFFSIEPIAKAAAELRGADRLDCFHVHFSGLKPTKKSLKNFSSPFIEVKGFQNQYPSGVEYRIVLRTSDPMQIRIPIQHKIREKGRYSMLEPQKGGGEFLWIFILLGALFVGTIVYLSFMKGHASRFF